VFESSSSGEVLTKGIPTEMTFFQELLDMLRGRASSTSFKETTTSEQRDDRKHFSGGSKFNNREEISQVIAEDIT